MGKISLKPTYAYTSNINCDLIRGGKEYFDKMISMIGTARESIHLHVYIFDADETGTMVANALIAAAKRQVDVYLLCDGFASAGLGEDFIKNLKLNGVNFRMFEPLFRSSNYYFGRRMHHKILVTDARFCLVGGINISNKYNDFEDQPSWLDWALFAEGEISAELVKVCTRMWTKNRVKAKRIIAKHIHSQAPAGDVKIRLRRNDWVINKTQVTASYYEMFRKAESEIIIMSSYFLPGDPFNKAMIKAAKRDVTVKLILAGRSDIRTAKLAERYLYRRLFVKNIEVYEFQPTILHGKIATYDKKWCTIGSYNVNNISAYASVELNLDVLNSECAFSVQEKLEEVIRKDCIRVTMEDYNKKYSVFHRLLQWTAFHILRIMFRVSTFYFRQAR